jgi:hypothetical protein
MERIINTIKSLHIRHVLGSWKTSLLSLLVFGAAMYLVYVGKATLTEAAAAAPVILSLLLMPDKGKEHTAGVIVFVLGLMLLTACATKRASVVETDVQQITTHDRLVDVMVPKDSVETEVSLLPFVERPTHNDSVVADVAVPIVIARARSHRAMVTATLEPGHKLKVRADCDSITKTVVVRDTVRIRERSRLEIKEREPPWIKTMLQWLAAFLLGMGTGYLICRLTNH